jgi:hypothetical protein
LFFAPCSKNAQNHRAFCFGVTNREPVRSANYFNDQTKSACRRPEKQDLYDLRQTGHARFKVTNKTVITKGAGAAKSTDIADNQEVSGAYWKNADGSLEAKLVKLGPPEKKSATPAANSSPSTTPSSSPTPSS